VPPLRERREDIELLAAAFLKEFAEENNKRIEGIDPKARAALLAFDWPGNVRQLRNTIESAVVLTRGPVITLEDLPLTIRGAPEGEVVNLPVGSTMIDAEKALIRATLAREGGNKSRTAEILGIGRKTLHRKLREYGLEN
jgi:DNA-binding NtrC family response regulator